jgi:DNA-binding XRE family transcriptional regulator
VPANQRSAIRRAEVAAEWSCCDVGNRLFRTFRLGGGGSQLPEGQETSRPGNSQIMTIPFVNLSSGKRKGKGWMVKTIYSREYAVVLQMLRAAREKAGITQVDLAKKLGLTQSFFSKIERGESRLDIVQLRTICNVLGLPLLKFVEQLEAELAQ